MKMASEENVTMRMKMGSVFSQIEVGAGRSGNARSGRRERRGPEPSRGGGTRGWIVRSAESAVVEVEDKRTILGVARWARIEGASARRRCGERSIDRRIHGGSVWI